MKKCFCEKDILHFFNLLFVFVCVFSIGLNVKFYLDNQILIELAAVYLNLSDYELTKITNDLYEANKAVNIENNESDENNNEKSKELEK